MSRKKFIAANWKLHKNQKESKAFLETFLAGVDTDNDIVICPTFTSLSTVAELINHSKVQLGAQNLSQHKSGAYTGEVSAEMLVELGVRQVIIGHSERRLCFGEDDNSINAKVQAALGAGLGVILCCGESDLQREQGLTDSWVSNQIKSALRDIQIDDIFNHLVIAYEPIWAIGTGKTCDSAEANRVIKVIRQQFRDIFGADNSDRIRILYGGSVKSNNASELISESDIDGALVGGASLDPSEFLKIITNSVACYN
jgi:triosephosphate isomerase (TIM)